MYCKSKRNEKKITVTPETETIVDKLMRVFLLEQEPDLKWGDIIGLKPHREIFLNKVILPAKRKKFEDAEKKFFCLEGRGLEKLFLQKLWLLKLNTFSLMFTVVTL